MDDYCKFRIEITSIEDFTTFVALIRGGEKADELIAKLLAEKLHTSSSTLDSSIKANS